MKICLLVGEKMAKRTSERISLLEKVWLPIIVALIALAGACTVTAGPAVPLEPEPVASEATPPAPIPTRIPSPAQSPTHISAPPTEIPIPPDTPTNTPGPAKKPTLINSYPPETSSTPTPAPPVPVKCTSGESETVAITIFSSKDSLIVYVPANVTIPLKDLNFEYLTSSGTNKYILASSEGFAFYMDGLVPPPFCLHLRRTGSIDPLPKVCQSAHTPIVSLPNGSVFWWNSDQAATRPLLVNMGQGDDAYLLGICNAGFRSCEIPVIRNCATPAPNSASSTIVFNTPTLALTEPPIPTDPERTTSPIPVSAPPPDAVVVAPALNLRSGPGVEYDPPIASLRNDDKLDIIGRISSNRWIQVIPFDRSISGWVSAWPEYVQVNVDLTSIPVVETPATPTGPGLVSAPVLLEPPDGMTTFKVRPDFKWLWDETLKPDDYFQVEIWNRYNGFETPIDVAWVKESSYRSDTIEEAYHIEYRWRVTAVRGIPVGEKSWSTSENPVWEPNTEESRSVSESSTIRTFFVEPGTEPPPDSPPGADDDEDESGLPPDRPY